MTGKGLNKVRLLIREDLPPGSTFADPWRVLWSLAGDVPLPETVALGAPLPGMTIDVPLTEPLEPKANYHVEVTNDEQRSDVYFLHRSVPTTVVIASGERHRSMDSFRDAVRTASPCGGGGPDVGKIVASVFLLAQVVLLVRGIACSAAPAVAPIGSLDLTRA